MNSVNWDDLRWGDRIVIPKGTPIVAAKSPRGKQPPTEVRATHVVTVHVYHPPTVVAHAIDTPEGVVQTHETWHPARIDWRGSGGYARSVEVTDALREANQ